MMNSVEISSNHFLRSIFWSEEGSDNIMYVTLNDEFRMFIKENNINFPKSIFNWENKKIIVELEPELNSLKFAIQLGFGTQILDLCP